MAEQQDKKRLQVEMDRQLLEAFQEAAKDEDITAAQLVRRWVKEYMSSEDRRQKKMGWS